jgi:hypothetical protein
LSDSAVTTDNLARHASAPRTRPARKRAAPRSATGRTGDDATQIGVGVYLDPAKPATPTREPEIPDVLTRVRREDRQMGGLELPEYRKKPGWDYEYKVIRVLNQPVDPSDFQEIRNAAWRAEKAVNWPELCEPGTPPDAPIERLGQRLYGRPAHFTAEARQEDLAAAYQQQRDRTMAAAAGKSAIRGEEGIPTGRAIRAVPLSIEIEGVAG